MEWKNSARILELIGHSIIVSIESREYSEEKKIMTNQNLKVLSWSVNWPETMNYLAAEKMNFILRWGISFSTTEYTMYNDSNNFSISDMKNLAGCIRGF